MESKRRTLSDDTGNAVRGGQRKTASLENLGLAVLVGVVGQDDNLCLFRVRAEIHSASH